MFSSPTGKKKKKETEKETPQQVPKMDRPKQCHSMEEAEERSAMGPLQRGTPKRVKLHT